MAFNPFHAFRKHQKAVFAGLTIICMLTFVLASGVSQGGDFFSELTRMIGGRARKTEVATLYGKPVDAREILLLREQRRIANDYMTKATNFSRQNLLQGLLGEKSPLDTAQRQEVQSILQNYMQALQSGFAFFYLDRIDRMQKDLAAAKKPGVDELGQLRLYLEEIRHEIENRFDDIYGLSDLYFGGSTTLEGLLDFMIWRREADRMGIQLAISDIPRQIRRATLNRLTDEESLLIQRNLSASGRYNRQYLLTALADEYRVRLAQDAILGSDKHAYQDSPALVTPYELWDYYLANRTEVSVKLLPIRVTDYLSKVTEKPSDADLQALYAKYKDVEPSPSRETPGFKQPRRIKVEWAGASAGSEYFQKQSRQWLLSLTASIPGSPWMGAALGAEFLDEYSSARTDFSRNFLKLPSWTDGFGAPAMYTYRYQNRPEGTAAVVGHMAGVMGTGVTPLAGMLGQQLSAYGREYEELAGPVREEAQQRAALAASILSQVTGPTRALGTVAFLDRAGAAERYLPLTVVQGQLTKKVESNLANDLVNERLEQFRTELDKRQKEAVKSKAKEKDEAAIAAYVKEQLAKPGWTHGATTEFHDRYDIGGDPALKTLRDVYLAQAGAKIDDPQAKRFADRFFSEFRPSASKLYTPEELRGEDGTYLFWTTSEQQPTMLPFDQVKSKVEYAWRFDKARALAQAEADRIAAKAREAQGDPVRNLIEESKGAKLDDLDGIARLKRSPSVLPDRSAAPEPYQVPPGKIEYPRLDFVSKVLEMKQVGDVSVISDQPRSVFYVAAVTHINPPSRDEFQKAQLLSTLQREQRTKNRFAIMAELRAQAKLTISDENRKQVDERSGGGGLEE